jgi:phage shock protein A
MSSSIPGAAESPALSTDETALLTRRVHAVQKVTEMASGGAARLLGRIRQLEGALDQLTSQFESLPGSARISLVTERMESLQAMLDWLTTRSAPNGNAADFVETQTRLSMSRTTLVDVQDEIQQAALVARRLREARDRIADLASEVEALEPTWAKAEALLLESRGVSTSIEHGHEPSTDPNGSG